jgi:hypothetical protein
MFDKLAEKVVAETVEDDVTTLAEHDKPGSSKQFQCIRHSVVGGLEGKWSVPDFIDTGLGCQFG